MNQAELTTDAAIATNTTTLDVGRNQSRAYINAFDARIYKHSPNAISLYIKNFGETPAKYFSLYYCVEIKLFDSEWFNQIEKSSDGSKWTALGPGEDTSIAILPKVGNLVNYKFGVTCIKGRIDYRTIYNEDYFTEFAYTLPPGYGFEHRDERASADDDDDDALYVRMIRPGTKQPLRAYTPVENQHHV